MPMATQDTPNRLLDLAQDLVQERGFNAFSYKDLAGAIGIKTASVHYHFPVKEDLGAALITRYRDRLDAALAEIDRGARSGKSKLRRFIQLYRDTEACGAICACGSLAADRETLPAAMQDGVEDYFSRAEQWIAKTISDGVRAGEFELAGPPTEAATTLLAGLQGGLILSRARPGRQTLEVVQRNFFRTLEPS